MRNQLLKIVLISGTLLTPSLSVNAQEIESKNTRFQTTCNQIDYIITSEGECVDLSAIASPPKTIKETGIKARFLSAFAKLDIPVKYEACEKATTVGTYNPAKNIVILCEAYRNKGESLEIETLAHEGWHVVQDCMTGLKDAELRPVSEGNPVLFASMNEGLTLADMGNLSLYDAEDLPYEIEAFAMEKKPEAVLKALDACASR
jgi:hypothetical protein